MSNPNVYLFVPRDVAALSMGADAVCAALEGRPAMVRHKPQLPAIEGLFGQPTVVNDLLTSASVPVILEKGTARMALTLANRLKFQGDRSAGMVYGGIAESTPIPEPTCHAS